MPVVGINIENYHFSEHYEEDKIKFDYQLKGICTTTNAKYLMQLNGIIRGDDDVKRIKEYYKQCKVQLIDLSLSIKGQII